LFKKRIKEELSKQDIDQKAMEKDLATKFGEFTSPSRHIKIKLNPEDETTAE
jgi:hypothetical protein